MSKRLLFMICQNLFAEKIKKKKKITNVLSAQLAHTVVKVKNMGVHVPDM